jgi:hypothetical protein
MNDAKSNRHGFFRFMRHYKCRRCGADIHIPTEETYHHLQPERALQGVAHFTIHKCFTGVVGLADLTGATEIVPVGAQTNQERK